MIKEKRLAIQICGHLRTFDKTYQSFYEHIILPNEKEGYKIDVFMHIWDEIEYQSLQWHNEQFPELRGKKITNTEINFIKENYKPVKLEYSEQLKIDDDTLFDEFTGGKTAFKTMNNVWYTKYRVNELRKEYEKEQNIQYDYVINTRPDILYISDFNIDKILDVYNNLLKPFDNPENKLFYSGCHRDMPIKDDLLLAASDILYFGKPNVMDKVSSIYLNLNKDELKSNFKSWESYLIYTANKNNIKPIQLGYGLQKDWKILRFEKSNPEKKRKRKFKLFSIRIRKTYIQIILFNISIKIEFGIYNK